MGSRGCSLGCVLSSSSFITLRMMPLRILANAIGVAKTAANRPTPLTRSLLTPPSASLQSRHFIYSLQFFALFEDSGRLASCSQLLLITIAPTSKTRALGSHRGGTGQGAGQGSALPALSAALRAGQGSCQSGAPRAGQQPLGARCQGRAGQNRKAPCPVPPPVGSPNANQRLILPPHVKKRVRTSLL